MPAIDSSSPTFANMINGQVNLRDAIRRQIDFEIGGKTYKLVPKPAVLIVRYVQYSAGLQDINATPQTKGMALGRNPADRRQYSSLCFYI